MSDSKRYPALRSKPAFSTGSLPVEGVGANLIVCKQDHNSQDQIFNSVLLSQPVTANLQNCTLQNKKLYRIYFTFVQNES